MKATNQEIAVLVRLIDNALALYNLEMGMSNFTELPLNDQITLDTSNEDGNFIAYAVTREKVVLWGDDNVAFENLDRDDIFTLQDIIADEYQLDINL